MQLSTMRTEARLIFNETDTGNTHVGEGQLNSWANEFYRLAQARLAVIPIKSRSYTSASSITLNSNTLTVDDAYIKNSSTAKFERLQVIDLDILASLDPGWQDAAVGAPKYLVRTGTFAAQLSPPPNSTYDAQTLKTYGMEFATDLAADTDTPDLPANIHDLFPHYMAHRAFQQLGLTDKAVAALIFVNSQLKSHQAVVTGFSRQRQAWVWDSNG